MSTVAPSGDDKQRIDRPVVRKRFVQRAKTLVHDPTFKKTVHMIREAWNEEYPSFALAAPQRPPSPLVARSLMVFMPPRIERAHAAATANREEAPPDARQAGGRWIDIVQTSCDILWPLEFYPNWLGPPLHPAGLFMSAALLWRPEFLDADDLIAYGNLGPRPVGYDPFDHWNTPGACHWRTFSNVLAEAIEDAIARGEPLTEEWRNELKARATRAGIAAHNARIASSPDELYWIFTPYPGMTGTDRDDLMSGITDALRRRYGDDPRRDQVRALSAGGMNPNQIAKLIGVDRKTVLGDLERT